MRNLVRGQLVEARALCSPSGSILKILTFLTMVGGLLILGLAGAALAKGYGGAWTPHALVAIGVFILLFSCLGFWAAVAKNRGVLCCFAISVGIITIFEFATAIACFALRSKIEEDIQWLYDKSPEDFAKVWPGLTPGYAKALASENLKLLGGFGLFLVLLQIINIVTAVLYRKALRDGEYEKWRSNI